MGLVGGRMFVVEGTVWLKRKSGGNNADGGDEGEILMEVKGNVHLKQ